MQVLDNPWRGRGLPESAMAGVPWPSTDIEAVRDLLMRCPVAARTPLTGASCLGNDVWIKDERGRMGLGSFKALGAAYVIADAAANRATAQIAQALAGEVYVTASACNHGLSVAAGARIFGARAVIYLARTVPEAFAARLRGRGAEVVRAGEDYEASMAAAMEAARKQGWTLLSDSSWEGYVELPHRLMEGYLALAAEITDEMSELPSHIFLQAGVGGLAGACAAWFRKVWGDEPRIVVVEPEHAPALQASIRAGRAVVTSGPVSNMGRLDCKSPSLIALKGLARDADHFVTISDAQAEAALADLATQGLASTASGAAGVAGLGAFGLPQGSCALCILSEDET